MVCGLHPECFLAHVDVGRLHLHPINESHQLRPTLTYLDVLSRKGSTSRPGLGSGSDSEGGPGPDETIPFSNSGQKQDAKEVQVSARRAEDNGKMPYLQGGLTSVRREMLLALRNEEEEKWEELVFCDASVRF
jgi:DNA-directed RNA polymerase III subunit RPC5